MRFCSVAWGILTQVEGHVSRMISEVAGVQGRLDKWKVHDLIVDFGQHGSRALIGCRVYVTGSGSIWAPAYPRFYARPRSCVDPGRGVRMPGTRVYPGLGSSPSARACRGPWSSPDHDLLGCQVTRAPSLSAGTCFFGARGSSGVLDYSGSGST